MPTKGRPVGGQWPDTEAKPPRIIPDGVGESSIPPVIAAMFKLLPPPNSQWPVYDRVAFLIALTGIFDVVYGKAPCGINVAARSAPPNL